MRDLTELFCKELTSATTKMAGMLLSIDANVRSHGGVALAGGWVRDLYFGVTPKDMDFVFWGLTVPEFHEAFQMWQRRNPGEFSYEVYDDDYNGARDGQIDCVIKINYEGQQMDWILYAANNLTEVLRGFDHSLNEFYAVYDSDFRLSIGHRDGWGVCTRNQETTVTPERVGRMKEMARLADWEYV